MKMPKLSKPAIIILIGVILFAVAIVAAAIIYTQNITWTIQNESFTVPNATTLDYGVIPAGIVKTETYTVTNNGNVEITVKASAQYSTITAGTLSWDKTTATIPVGESTTFTLTLTITGAGSCTVTIQKA